jgi:hypothetical protein
LALGAQSQAAKSSQTNLTNLTKGQIDQYSQNIQTNSSALANITNSTIPSSQSIKMP